MLIYGRDERAIEAANLLKDHLDVTVLITAPKDLAPPRVTEFPVVQGTIRSAKGHLGAFEITVDDYAQPAPSSRGALASAPARDGAVSRCDLVLDLSGGAPLFPAADLRDGYLRADPARSGGGARAPCSRRAISSAPSTSRATSPSPSDLCAHSRSRIVGCRRCLDLCPTGAITPAGDHVAIDAQICAGCGQCAAVCPTGAAGLCAAAGRCAACASCARCSPPIARPAASAPIVLLHDDAHGAPLIDALARHGDGLPANVLPLAVNEVTQVGLEAIAAAFAYGAAALRFLMRAQAAPRHGRPAQTHRARRADPRRPRLRRRTRRHDRDRRSRCARRRVARHRAGEPAPRPASFTAGRRQARRAAARAARAAPRGAGAGRRHRAAGRARRSARSSSTSRAARCASPACRPARPARCSDDPERPMLRFAEDACVQCGLCKATCPEKVISAQPAARFPRRHRARARAQGGGAVPLHPLRQAVRREEHDRARRRQARGQALDVQGSGAAPRRHQDVRGLPRRRGDRAGLRPLRRPAAPAPRTTEDYLREREERAARERKPET